MGQSTTIWFDSKRRFTYRYNVYQIPIQQMFTWGGGLKYNNKPIDILTIILQNYTLHETLLTHMITWIWEHFVCGQTALVLSGLLTRWWMRRSSVEKIYSKFVGGAHLLRFHFGQYCHSRVYVLILKWNIKTTSRGHTLHPLYIL